MAAIKKILGKYILLDTSHFSANNGVFDHTTDDVQSAFEILHDKISVLTPENTLKLNTLDQIIQEQIKDGIISSSQIIVDYDYTTKQSSFRLADGFLDGLINVELNELTDVNLAGATSGQFLVYRDDVWKNVSLKESDITDLNKYTRQEVNDFLAGKAPALHSHNDVYFTEAEIDTRPWWKNVSTSTNYSSSNKDYIFVDTTFDVITITLPANPSNNYRVYFVDSKGSFSENSLVINRNGSTIMGKSEDLIVDVNNINFEMLYVGSDWRIIR